MSTLLAGVIGGHYKVATHAPYADVCTVAKLTVVWAEQAGVPISRVVSCWAAPPTLPLVQEALPAVLIYSTGDAVRRCVSLAFLAGVMTWVALVLKFKFP